MSKRFPLYFFTLSFAAATNLMPYVSGGSHPPYLPDFLAETPLHVLLTISLVCLGGILASLTYRFLVK